MNELLLSPYESHSVFYIPATDVVMIARVLHGSMDYQKVFEGYDPIADLPT